MPPAMDARPRRGTSALRGADPDSAVALVDEESSVAAEPDAGGAGRGHGHLLPGAGGGLSEGDAEARASGAPTFVEALIARQGALRCAYHRATASGCYLLTRGSSHHCIACNSTSSTIAATSCCATTSSMH